MTDAANYCDSIERALNIDIQYSVFAIAPQLGYCNILIVAEIIEIGNRPQLGYFFEKSVTSVVDRGQNS